MTVPSDDLTAAVAAERVQALRRRRGLSQEQFARELGVSFASVNRWETGRTRMSAGVRDRFRALEAAMVDAIDDARGTRGPAQRSAAAPPEHAAPSAGAADDDVIGRVTELEDLRELATHHRGVCLVGPGGLGKTTLARRLVDELSDAPLVVEMGAVQRGDRVAAAIATAAGLRDAPGSAAADSLATAFTGPRPVLLLDGIEHVAAAAAAVADDLLATVPQLRVVMTSRRPVGSTRTTSYAVPPLTCPPAGRTDVDVSAFDAVQLFRHCARSHLTAGQVRSLDPDLVGEVCRRSGGLPLAIELTAAWLSTLSLQEILTRREALLRSTDSGEDAIHAALQTSFALLSGPAQALLIRLSVFAGSFAVDDAAEVVGEPGAGVVHDIRALVETAWLRVHHDNTQNRFSMLDPIREFAAELMTGVPDRTAIAERHARHFATLADAAETGLASPELGWWRTRMGAAAPDVDRALSWAVTTGDRATGLRACAGLWRWWLMSGQLLTGRAWLARFLDPVPRTPRPGVHNLDPLVSARAMAGDAVLAAESGDYRAAVTRGETALDIFRHAGDAAAAAFAATAAGSAHRYLGETTAARALFELAMQLRQEAGDRRGVSVSQNNLALLALDEGDLVRARDLFEASTMIKREIGDPRALALGLGNLADVLVRQRQLDRAADVIDEGLLLASDLGDRQLLGTLHCNLADVLAARGEWQRAEERYAEAIDEHRTSGHPHDVVVALVGSARALHQLGQTPPAAARLREARHLASETDSPTDLAMIREASIELRASRGDLSSPARSARPRSRRANGSDGVTAREAQILGILARGLSNRDIAATLQLSISTVERHLATIYRKLGVRGRVEAARYATEHGLD